MNNETYSETSEVFSTYYFKNTNDTYWSVDHYESKREGGFKEGCENIPERNQMVRQLTLNSVLVLLEPKVWRWCWLFPLLYFRQKNCLILPFVLHDDNSVSKMTQFAEAHSWQLTKTWAVDQLLVVRTSWGLSKEPSICSFDQKWRSS